jgi:hypothetical protein
MLVVTVVVIIYHTWTKSTMGAELDAGPFQSESSTDLLHTASREESD